MEASRYHDHMPFSRYTLANDAASAVDTQAPSTPNLSARIPGSVGAWKYGQTVKTQTFRQPNISDARIQVSFFLDSELELRHF